MSKVGRMGGLVCGADPPLEPFDPQKILFQAPPLALKTDIALESPLALVPYSPDKISLFVTVTEDSNKKRLILIFTNRLFRIDINKQT